MKRIFSILLVMCLLCSLTACGGDRDGNPVSPSDNANKVETPSTNENTGSDIPLIPNPTDDCVKDETDQTVKPSDINFTFDMFDSKYLNYDSVSFFDFSCSLIAFPSSVTFGNAWTKAFTTESEWNDFHRLYDNLREYKNNFIEIREGDGYSFSHGGSAYDASGRDYQFAFVSHPLWDAHTKIEEDQILYDEETKTIYVILAYDLDYKYGSYDGTYEQVRIESESTCAHGIFCYAYDADEIEVNEIKFIVPNPLND